MKFTDLNLEPELLEALSYMGFEKATPIQEQAIPIVLNNEDLIACAQTGTGKTGAFVLPILNKLVGKEDSSIDTLIVVPTRELAVQIEKQIQGLSYFVSVGSIAVYGGGGGKEWEEQKMLDDKFKQEPTAEKTKTESGKTSNNLKWQLKKPAKAAEKDKNNNDSNHWTTNQNHKTRSRPGILANGKETHLTNAIYWQRWQELRGC